MKNKMRSNRTQSVQKKEGSAGKKRPPRPQLDGRQRTMGGSALPSSQTAGGPAARAVAPSVYSNAFNFTSYQDGKTDLRTGQYSAIVNLATIRPQGASEGSREVKLVFSALSTSNAGYGIGWRISESQFDLNTMVLNLASGETFTAKAVPPEGRKFAFQDMKLENVAVVYTDSTTITVYYLDGTTEVLRRPEPGQPYRTSRLIFENGETFTFTYVAGKLAKIVNTTMGKEVLELTYKFGALQKARALVQGGRIAEIFLTSSNELITEITIPYDNTNGTADPNAQPKYVYSYRPITPQAFQVITQVKNPMGGTEAITYNEQGLRYYNSDTYLPVVHSTETRTGAGQPSIVKVYTFSKDQNFTGYPYNGGFQAGRDNLYSVTGRYEYSGEEKTINPDAGDAVLQRVTSTFNKFHLMLRQETRSGTATRLEEYAYNEDPKLEFPQQPPNLQVPRQVKTTYSDSGASRSETLDVESDRYGNTIKKTEASGIRFEYLYYPTSGDGTKCPPEPSGHFVRYCRQEKIVPAGGSGQDKTIEMTYDRVALVQGAGYFVMEKQRATNAGMVSINQYVNDLAKPVIHGRIKSIDIAIGGKHTVTQFTYLQSGTDLEETRAVTGHDGKVTSAGQKVCTLTDWLLQTQKAGEAAVAFEYDVIGRVVRQAVAPGTAYEARNTYVYRFATTSPSSPAWVEETDAKSRRYATRFDGKGRVVSSAQLLAGGQERRIKEFKYDRLGNKAEQTIYDQLENRELRLLTRYEYNGWNELAKTVQPDGSIVLSQRDMVANTLTTGIQGLNTTINVYNAFNKVKEVMQVSSAGVRVKTLERQYDGFGRSTSATNVYGHLTNYAYDAFDRIAELRMQPADATGPRTVAMTYADFSSGDLPTQTAVNGTVLGKRAYDGIGRTTSTANGQAAPTTYAYNSEAMQPSSSTSPRGIRLDYNYNRELGALMAVASPNDGTSRFSHNPISGQVDNVDNSTATRHNTYNEWDALQSEQVTFAGQTTETTYQTSPQGRPLRVTTTLGGTLAQRYDDAGRLMESAGGGFTENIAYDSFGRVASITASLAGITLQTALTYDSYGREGTRTLRLQGNVLQTIQRSFSQSGQLIERTTTDGAGTLLSRENFAYDAYSRLISFTCTGSRYPSDSQGRRLKSQTFTYDALDNITKVESGYVDGTSNTSTRSFSSTVPTQLVRITETQPAGAYDLTYDADGNLVRDHRGRTYAYDQFGRMSTATPGGVYSYDADGRMVMQAPPSATPLQLFYAYDQLSGQQQGQTSVSFHRDSAAVRGRTIRTGTETRNELNGLDISNSVITRTNQNGQTVDVMYTPYGENGLNLGVSPNDLAAQPAIAFNGERLDVLANLYHLGNGLRAYSPELMVFLSPDPLSPFGEGGLNGYAYCGCDPINAMDPTGLGGLGFFKALIGVLIALVIFVAAVASVVTGGASLLGVLGAIGAGLALVSATLGAASAGVEWVDEMNGWDRSSAVRGLNIAEKVFGVLATLVSFGTAVGGGVQAGRTARNTYEIGRGGLEGSRTSIGKSVWTGFKEFGKVLVGVSSEETFSKGVNRFLSVVGVGSYAAGKVETVVGFIQNQTATDGSNGSGQGAIDRPRSSDRAGTGGESGGSPYETAFEPILDSISNVAVASQDYDQLAKRLRLSINSQLYAEA